MTLMYLHALAYTPEMRFDNPQPVVRVSNDAMDASDVRSPQHHASTTKMPRIPNALLRQARAIDAFLPALLAPCRDLHTAQNELRWLREHVNKVAKARRARGDLLAKGALLHHLVQERASGKPLQYILGTEHFGDLEIQCRPGVLIPRWVVHTLPRNITNEEARQDTAASITHLVQSLQKAHGLPPELRLLDLCTGTGCIPLLFQHELYSLRDDITLRALGVDVSSKALKLARHNNKRAQRGPTSANPGKLDFMKADVLINPFADQVAGPLPLKAALNYHDQPSFWDILISNPPYISPSNYWKTTIRSVRGYEPKLALVPPAEARQDDTEQGDLFYPRLLRIAQDVEAKVVLLEVADLAQALRIARLVQALDIFDGVEIWREEPGAIGSTSQLQGGVSVIGEGNARSVLCWRGAGTLWLGKSITSVSPDVKWSTPAVPGPPTESNVSTAPQFDPTFFGDSQLNSPARPMRVAFPSRHVNRKD